MDKAILGYVIGNAIFLLLWSTLWVLENTWPAIKLRQQSIVFLVDKHVIASYTFWRKLIWGFQWEKLA
jgi:hypothetical protein